MDASKVEKSQERAYINRQAEPIAAGEPFGPLRTFLWPIYHNELKKFIPTAAIFFIFTFIYDMLRNLKTSLVVAASQNGAEVIPFIKVWAMLPGAFLFASLFIKLSQRFNREQTFYIMLSIFIGFFSLFTTVIYPWREFLELDGVAQWVGQQLPIGMGGFAMMLRYWPLTLFYVMTELWGCILLSMLFWGFANEVTKVEEAKRFYPFFLLGANIAAICAGQVGAYYTEHTFNPQLPFGTSAWDQSLMFFLGTAVIGGSIIMVLFWWMHQQEGLITTRPDARGLDADQDSKHKVKLTLRECFIHLKQSKHLLYIALMVLSYNIVFNLSDVTWTHQLKVRYQDDVGEMTRYLSQITTITGVIAVMISLLVSGHVLRRFGWKATAMITPVTVGVSCCGFFILLLCEHWPFVDDLLTYFSTSSLNLIIILGSVQMCFSRSCKYTLFDTSKEIAFIPLATQDQRYGKAAIDGVGSRLGKSTGSLIFQILFVCCASIAETTPYVAAIVFVVLFVWCFAVTALSRRLSA